MAMAEMTEESSPPALHGSFEGIVHGCDLCVIRLLVYGGVPVVAVCRRSVVVLYGIVVHPVAGVPALHLAFASPVVVSGKERLVFVTEAFEGFQFAAEIDASGFVAPYIKGNDTDRVAGNQVIVRLFVVEGESEDAVQLFEEVDAFVFIKGKDDLAVRTRLESVFPGIAGTDVAVVVNFAVDGKNLFAVG